MILSPHDISVLLHHHTCPLPWPTPSPAYEDTLDAFIKRGVLKPDKERDHGTDKSYMTTDLGAAWVNAICNTPIPRLVYLDQNGKEIVP